VGQFNGCWLCPFASTHPVVTKTQDNYNASTSLPIAYIMHILDELKDDYERADALVNILIDRATGGSPSEIDFTDLRRYFVDHSDWSPLLPRWFSSKRSLNQFWGFIKNKFSNYADRRNYLETISKAENACNVDTTIASRQVE
jgi:hypothetical protein